MSVNADVAAVEADPYAVLGTLRSEAPVYRHEGLDAYWVTRYADVHAILGDEETFPSIPPGRASVPGQFIFDAGDRHSRYRRPAAAPFGLPNLRRHIEPVLPGLVDELLAAFEHEGRADLVASLAAPLPAMVMRRVLQMPELDEGPFSHDMEVVVEAASNPARTDLLAELRAAQQRIGARMEAVLARERTEPGGGLVTELMSAQMGGEPFSDTELVNMFSILAFGGIETTRNLIANMAWALAAHPGERERLLDDRSLLPSAIEETLRYLSPNLFRLRYAVSDVGISGTPVPAGATVYAFLASANRDPDVYDDPDRFDVARFSDPSAVRPHLAFGWGPHFCLGAHLTRMEAFHAMDAVLDRLPGFRLTDPGAVTFAGFRHRAPRNLDLEFDRRP